jgi:aryl-alcohol dehydrogenase-like predicted oxidoreductase
MVASNGKEVLKCLVVELDVKTAETSMILRSTCQNLVLGTAQFGNNYGIANRSGKVSRSEALRLLDLARTHGVDTLDTAVVYGDAESRLGEIGVGDFKIVTKVPGLPSCVNDPNAWLLEMIKGSLSRLRVPRLHGLLLHHAGDLAGASSNQLMEALARMRESGLVEHIGASIYAPSDLEPIDDMAVFDLIQAPMNVFDRRIDESGLLERLQNEGVEVHIRSAFLQGLLLIPPTEMPNVFAEWVPDLERWCGWCQRQGLTQLEACLAHVRASAPNAKIVVGCDSALQLEEILEAYEKPAIYAPAELRSADPQLINPTLWRHK